MLCQLPLSPPMVGPVSRNAPWLGQRSVTGQLQQITFSNQRNVDVYVSHSM